MILTDGGSAQTAKPVVPIRNVREVHVVDAMHAAEACPVAGELAADVYADPRTDVLRSLLCQS